MTDTSRTDLSVRRERALLLGLLPRGQKKKTEHPLEELASLAKTAGARVVGEAVQFRDRVDPGTFVGKGKAEEVALLAEELDVDVIITDNDLSPAQIRTLEKIIDRKVVDRSELILDIFATHARTRQARLQVELAQLEYTYPRLTRMWSHLSRYEGGIGTRGPGETQLETDRRLVNRRIVDLKRELEKIDLRRLREVRSRESEFKVSLVGYTNAGKSTLMNALTDAGVRVEDRLFATLDTKTRKWSLDGRSTVLLSDTVGFIRNLPHHLVESFKATLEEARNADLLMHVVDVSHPEAIQQVEAVTGVLGDIDCRGKRVLVAFNKMDAVEDPTEVNILRERFPDAIAISALRGEGLVDLANAVERERLRDFVEIRVRFPASDGRLSAWLYEKGEVISSGHTGSTMDLRVQCHRRHLGALRGHAQVTVDVLGDEGGVGDP